MLIDEFQLGLILAKADNGTSLTEQLLHITEKSECVLDGPMAVELLNILTSTTKDIDKELFNIIFKVNSTIYWIMHNKVSGYYTVHE